MGEAHNKGHARKVLVRGAVSGNLKIVLCIYDIIVLAAGRRSVVLAGAERYLLIQRQQDFRFE
jgi:hypothetical protein